MNGWPVERLDKCCQIVSGATPSTSVREYWDGDIPWVTPKDLSELTTATISDTPRKLTAAGLAASSASLLPPGSVLFSSRAPIGHVAINTVAMATNQGFKSFVPNPERIHAPYLYWWLQANRTYLQGLGNGATFKEVSKAVVSRIEIPVPPISEQRRIAAILDQADHLRAKRRAALARLDGLTQSIFVDMFGDPAMNPKRLPVEAFGANVRSIRYGTGSPPPYVADGVPFIRATNVKAGTVASKDLKFISPLDAQRISKCRLSSGNLVVVRSGVNTGDCAIIPKEYDGACAAFDLIVDLAYEDAVYYNFLINSPFGKAQIARLSRRAAQPHLNAEQLKSLEYIAPPSDQRAEFCRRISGIERLALLFSNSLSTLDHLFGSLQQRAFRGEL